MDVSTGSGIGHIGEDRWAGKTPSRLPRNEHRRHGDNVFQGRVIEVHIGTLLADQAFTFTDWTAEMKAKASICISEDETLIESLEIAKARIQTMRLELDLTDLAPGCGGGNREEYSNASQHIGAWLQREVVSQRILTASGLLDNSDYDDILNLAF